MRLLTDRLQRKIDLLGYSRKRFAEACGFSREALNTWLNGIRNPKASSVKKMADFLGCPMEEIAETESHGMQVSISTGDHSAVYKNTCSDGDYASLSRRILAADDLSDAEKVKFLRFLQEKA